LTLIEAGRYFDQWLDDPPVYAMIRGLIDGLSGRKGQAPPRKRRARKAGPARPMPKPGELWGLDRTGFPIPTLDMKELRERNRQRLADGARRRLSSAGKLP
jgi:hypothetical protein